MVPTLLGASVLKNCVQERLSYFRQVAVIIQTEDWSREVHIEWGVIGLTFHGHEGRVMLIDEPTLAGSRERKVSGPKCVY